MIFCNSLLNISFSITSLPEVCCVHSFINGKFPSIGNPASLKSKALWPVCLFKRTSNLSLMIFSYRTHFLLPQKMIPIDRCFEDCFPSAKQSNPILLTSLYSEYVWNYPNQQYYNHKHPFGQDHSIDDESLFASIHAFLPRLFPNRSSPTLHTGRVFLAALFVRVTVLFLTLHNIVSSSCHHHRVTKSKAERC